MHRLTSLVLVRFGISGLLSTAIFFVLANLLTSATALSDTICSLVAYLLSLGFSYALQSRFTFRVVTDSGYQVVRFAITTVIGLAIATGIVYVCSERLGWPSWVGTALVCFLIPIANFLAFRWWVFADADGRV